MNILDAVIITILIVGVLGGMSRGLIKQAVLLIGLVVCLVFAFSLRTPIATFMYEYLPFFKFGGLFSGVSIINILLYIFKSQQFFKDCCFLAEYAVLAVYTFLGDCLRMAFGTGRLREASKLH